MTIGEESLGPVQHPSVFTRTAEQRAPPASEPEPDSVNPSSRSIRRSPARNVLATLLRVAGDEDVVRAQSVRGDDDADRPSTRDSSSMARIFDVSHSGAAESAGKIAPISPSRPSP